jgi:hypothetical protein
LEKAGGYKWFSRILNSWRVALDKHMTTWPEYPDPTRSDCHAWSSWIAADFITSILGIQPESAGFASIRLAPQITACQSAKGRAPTPQGFVRVSWEKSSEKKLRLNASVPLGIPTTLILPGVEPIRYQEGGDIVFIDTL